MCPCFVLTDEHKHDTTSNNKFVMHGFVYRGALQDG